MSNYESYDTVRPGTSYAGVAGGTAGLQSGGGFLGQLGRDLTRIRPFNNAAWGAAQTAPIPPSLYWN